MVTEVTLRQPLTTDQVRERIARRLPPGTTLVGKVVFRTDFTVRRTGALGVAVKVETGAAGTKVRLYGLAPGFGYRLSKGFGRDFSRARKGRRREQEGAPLLAEPPAAATPRPVVAMGQRPVAVARPMPVAPKAQQPRPPQPPR